MTDVLTKLAPEGIAAEVRACLAGPDRLLLVAVGLRPVLLVSTAVAALIKSGVAPADIRCGRMTVRGVGVDSHGVVGRDDCDVAIVTVPDGAVEGELAGVMQPVADESGEPIQTGTHPSGRALMVYCCPAHQHLACLALEEMEAGADRPSFDPARN